MAFVDGFPLSAGELNSAIGMTWSDWVPTWTNLTLGNGTQKARYVKNGGTAHFYLQVLFGSTTALHASNLPMFTLPVASKNLVMNSHVSLIDVLPGTGAEYMGWATITATTCLLYSINVGSTYPFYREVHRTAPFAWAAGDIIQVSGTYEAA